jgi:hypothetical protein
LNTAAIQAVVPLQVTPDWRWRKLIDLQGPARWPPFVAAFTAVAVAIMAGMVLWLRPHAVLSMPTERTGLWLAMMAAYSVLSVIGQEIIVPSPVLAALRPLDGRSGGSGAGESRRCLTRPRLRAELGGSGPDLPRGAAFGYAYPAFLTTLGNRQ